MKFFKIQTQPNKTTIPGLYPVLDEKDALKCTIESLIISSPTPTNINTIPPEEFVEPPIEPPEPPEPPAEPNWYLYGNPVYSEIASSISMNKDGNTVAVGGYYATNTSGEATGSVKVYSKTNPWTQKGQTLYGPSGYQNFGSSVSLNKDGTVLAVAMDDYLSTPGVYVYYWDGSSWIQKGSIIQNSFSNVADVAINDAGDRIAIGDANNDAVYCYEYTTDWVQLGLTLPNIPYAYCGASVAINSSGDTIAYSAPYTYDPPSDRYNGACAIYQYNGTSWIQKGSNISGLSNYDYMGEYNGCLSMDDSGNKIIIGAPSGGTTYNQGYAIVYTYDGSSWNQLGQTLNGVGGYGSKAGSSVSINSAGNVIAYVEYDPAYNDSNIIKIYQLNGSIWEIIKNQLVISASLRYTYANISMDSTGMKVVAGTDTGYVTTNAFHRFLALEYANTGSIPYNPGFESNSTVTVKYDPSQNCNQMHQCDAAVYQLYINAILVGTVNLNNSSDGSYRESVFNITDVSEINRLGIGPIVSYDLVNNVTGDFGWGNNQTHKNLIRANIQTLSLGSTNDFCVPDQSFDINMLDTPLIPYTTGLPNKFVPYGERFPMTLISPDTDLIIPKKMSRDGSRIVFGAPRFNYGIGYGRVNVYEFDLTLKRYKRIGQELDYLTDMLVGVTASGNSDLSRIIYGKESSSGENEWVKVFQYDGTSWVQMGSTFTVPFVFNIYGGLNVDMNDTGNLIVIASARSNFIKVYEWNGSSWIQKGSTITGTTNIGSFVQFNKTGSMFGSIDQSSPPIFKAYEWNGSDWIQKGSSISLNGLTPFGSLAVNDNGTRIAFAPGTETNFTNSSQNMVIYDWNGSDWSLNKTISTTVGNKLGSTINLNSTGNRLFITRTNTTTLVSTILIYDYTGSDWVLYKEFSPLESGLYTYSQEDREYHINADGTLLTVPIASYAYNACRVYQDLGP